MTYKNGLMITLGLGLAACGGPDDDHAEQEVEDLLYVSALVAGTHTKVPVQTYINSDGAWVAEFDDSTHDDDLHMSTLDIPVDARQFQTMADFQAFILATFGGYQSPTSGTVWTEVLEIGPIYNDQYLTDPNVGRVLEIEDPELAIVGGKAGGVYINSQFMCLDENGCPAGMLYPSYLQEVDEDMPAEPGDDDFGQEFLPKAKVSAKTSVVFIKFDHTPSTFRARSTLARMSSAFLVQTNGLAYSLLCALT